MHCILIFFIRRAVYNAAMKNIVVLDEMTMRGGMLRPSFPHRWTAHPQTSPGQVAERIQSAHIVITNKVPVAAADIRRAKDLQLVAVAATGVDNIALPACRAAGIAVCNVRDYASRSVAEHVVALLFALARGVVRHHQKTVAGEWSASPVFSPDMGSIQNVERMRLGVLGAGALGRATARLAKQIGMRPVFWRREKRRFRCQNRADDFPAPAAVGVAGIVGRGVLALSSNRRLPPFNQPRRAGENEAGGVFD